MSVHSFEPDIAALVGLAPAVIYQNIRFWCEKNSANDKHIHDGKAWTYNTNAAFQKQFSYLTADQVRRAIEKLVEAGLIAVGNFNVSAYDRTRWFCDLRHVHLAETTNGSGENARPIPDINTYHKPDSKHDLFGSGEPQGDDVDPKQDAKVKSDEQTAHFAAFWAAYPPCQRKTDRPKAMALFRQITDGKHKVIAKTAPEIIIAGVAAYAKSRPDPQYIPMPTTWLNGERWLNAAAPAPKSDHDFWTGPRIA